MSRAGLKWNIYSDPGLSNLQNRVPNGRWVIVTDDFNQNQILNTRQNILFHTNTLRFLLSCDSRFRLFTGNLLGSCEYYTLVPKKIVKTNIKDIQPQENNVNQNFINFFWHFPQVVQVCNRRDLRRNSLAKCQKSKNGIFCCRLCICRNFLQINRGNLLSGFVVLR